MIELCLLEISCGWSELSNRIQTAFNCLDFLLATLFKKLLNLFLLLSIDFEVVLQWRNIRPLILFRLLYYLINLSQLVKLPLGVKQGAANDHLCEGYTKRPYINLLSVLIESIENLNCLVVETSYVFIPSVLSLDYLYLVQIT